MRNLVYTSAGDNSNIRNWFEGRKDFDLWVNYYGDADFQYTSECEHYSEHKGSKFQTLNRCFKDSLEVFSRYDSIFVLDDDLLFSGNDIRRLFNIREKHSFALAQPAFDPRGKISHPITRFKPFSLYRVCNFVEVTCPLFRTDVLTRFMQIYDDRLVGWGVDLWFSDYVVKNDLGPMAIIDAITCINPLDTTKAQGREIERLQSTALRQQMWELVRSERGLDIPDGHVVVSTKHAITNPNGLLSLLRATWWELSRRND